VSVREGQFVTVPSAAGRVLGTVVTVAPGAVVVDVEGTLARVPTPQVHTLAGQPVCRPLVREGFPIR
jgi:hypothetical protein